MPLSRTLPWAMILLLLFVPYLGDEGSCHAQERSFYEDFLMQRMMIAKIRESRGDFGAKRDLREAVKEAEKSGMSPPMWAESMAEGVSSWTEFAKGSQQKEVIGERAWSKEMERYGQLILESARIYGVPQALIKAVIHVESAFREDAVSPAGAQGLMQLMPGTAREIGVRDPFNPRFNVLGGTKLLRQFIDEFGSVKKALIAYNAGPDRVRSGRTIPEETRRYVPRVLHYYQFYKEKGL